MPGKIIRIFVQAIALFKQHLIRHFNDFGRKKLTAIATSIIYEQISPQQQFFFDLSFRAIQFAEVRVFWLHNLNGDRF
jgi:hypothetical protein